MAGSSSGEAVVGVWDGHGASVSVVADGELVFALAEERVNRRKRFSGFPKLALERALAWMEERGLWAGAVAMAGWRGRSPVRFAERWYRDSSPHREPLGLASRLVMDWENQLAGSGVGHLEAHLSRTMVRRRLSRTGLKAPVISVDHHDAHAWAAALCEGELVLTADAYGEGRSATLRRATAMDDVLAAEGPSFGLALLYGAVTVALGYREGDEGKVMGLAALGDPEPARTRFAALFTDEPVPRLRAPLRSTPLEATLAGLSREDAAAGLQAFVTEKGVAWVRHLLRPLGPARLVAAGGLFANVRLNQELRALPEVFDLRVFPAMGDEGLSAGAAHLVWAQGRRGRDGVADRARLRTARVGVDFGAEARALARHVGATAKEPEELGHRLAAGEVICRYAGREAFGPRALGGRSVLFRPDQAIAARVNTALRRDPIMAFAPVMTEQAAAELLEGSTDFPHMTITTPATLRMRELCPAAVHVDGTVRPQVVREEHDPELHALLSAARAHGVPALINTSFNLHGEPIVHTPDDALRTYRASGLDWLVLEDGAHARRG